MNVVVTDEVMTQLALFQQQLKNNHLWYIFTIFATSVFVKANSNGREDKGAFARL